MVIMDPASKCHLCSEKFKSLAKLSAHTKRRHVGLCDRKNKTIECNICGHKFSTRRGLLHHIRVHTGERPFKCTEDDCGRAFITEWALSNHIKNKHSNDHQFICEFPGCVYATITSQKLVQHEKKHSSDRPHACPIDGCSYRSKWKSCVTTHLNGVHNDAKAFACSKCNYKTSLSGRLKLHMRRHSSRKDFKCSFPQCTKSCKDSRDLKSHFSNQHGERNMQCDHLRCGRKFANVKALNTHKRVVHSDKRHLCPNPECNYSTNNKRSLARHMIVHDKKNEKISCLIEGCEHKAKNSNALKSHISRHKMQLPCPVPSCGQYVFSEEALKKHLNLHNQLARPFQCSLCFKNFQAVDYLQKHCVVHTSEKPFKCGHCEFVDARGQTIRTHISAVHAKTQFPFIIHLLDDCECLHCEVILPGAQFVVHCMTHAVPVVLIERLKTRWS